MALELSPLMDIRFDIREPVSVGSSHFGSRLIYEITGGSFHGERLKGRVLSGGSDCVLFDSEGLARLDVRVCLVTHDDAALYMTLHGLLIPNDRFTKTVEAGDRTEYGEAYLVTHQIFEAGHDSYRWLNRVMAVSEGRCSKTCVEHRAYELINH